MPPPSAIPRPATARGKYRLTPVSVERQIFKGCQFFFFPNNDINSARRFRIIKALEYGASWQKEFSIYVTHVIVDQGLSYGELLKHIGRDSLPPSVIVVNENWPPECLTFGVLVNHNSTSFRLPGVLDLPRTGESQLKITSTAQQEHHYASDTSLKLKAAGKAVQTRSPSTPRSSTSQSSQHISTSRIGCENDSSTGTESGIEHGPHGVVHTNAEFDLAISQAKQLRFISFEDDNPDDRAESLIEDTVNVDTEDAAPKTNADNFQCMQAHTGEGSDLANAETIAVLEQMVDYYKDIQDHWRQSAYRKAIATLRRHPEKVMNKEQASKLPHIGTRLAEKIEEISTTHSLRRLDSANADPQAHALKMFLRIYGVGLVQANKWIREGHRTIDDLLQKAKLTHPQRVGIDHYEHFNLRIPRTEVKQHGELVLKVLRSYDKGFSLTIGGSYRRGSMTSGDIDCIISHPAFSIEEMHAVVMNRILPSLKAIGFIKADLATSNRLAGSKWLGASCLADSSIWRRIDFLLVPAHQLGAAMIYFTGNDIFNRSIRLLASKKGYRLNEKGLFRNVMIGPGRERLTDGTLVEGRSEQRIFEILGVPWREPCERII